MRAPTLTRRWNAEATALFLRTADGIDDAGLDRPTGLPGWTRAHLLAHVASNAVALGRLVSWACTGRETRMYDSPRQRAEEIERGARLPAAELRARVRAGSAELEAAFASLTAPGWAAEVVTAQGRTVPAAELPWLRVREVAVHAVDLAAGVGFDDLPAEFCRALVADVVRLRDSRGGGPALRLTATDSGGSWTVEGAGVPVRAAAPVAGLAGWLTGRSSPAGLPTLPDWL